MKVLFASFAALLALGPVAKAQSPPSGWNQVNANVSLSVSNVSLAAQLPGVGATPNAPNTNVCNIGAAAAYVAFGTSSSVLATTGNSYVAAGVCKLFSPPNNATFIAAITSSGTTTLEIEAGFGSPQSSLPGGGAGSLTPIADGTVLGNASGSVVFPQPLTTLPALLTIPSPTVTGTGVTINPTALSTNKGITLTQSGPASIVAPGGGTPFAYNTITIGDQSAVSNDALKRAVGVFELMTTSGTGTTGTKLGHYSMLRHFAPSTDGADHIALIGSTYANVVDGTYVQNYGGALGCFLLSGATGQHGCIGLEADVEVDTGASVLVRAGVRAVNAGDLPATGDDAAFAVSSTNTAGAFKNFLQISDQIATTVFPLQTTGKILSSSIAGTVDTAFDLSNITMSSYVINAGSNFQVTGAGAETAASVKVIGTSAPSLSNGQMAMYSQSSSLGGSIIGSGSAFSFCLRNSSLGAAACVVDAGGFETFQKLSADTSLSVGGANLTLATGEIGLTKIAASGTAPGATGGKFGLVCGTNAGSAKIIAYAGTSTTPSVVLDNIGSGVTGC